MTITALYLKQRYPGIITDDFYTGYSSYLTLLINEKYLELDSCYWGQFYDKAVSLSVMSELLKNPPTTLSGVSGGTSGPMTSRSVPGEYSISFASKAYNAQSLAEFNGNTFDLELADLEKQCGTIGIPYPTVYDDFYNEYGYLLYADSSGCNSGSNSTIATPTLAKLQYDSKGLVNAAAIKNTPGIVYSFSALNTDSVTHYVQLFNSAFSPQPGDSPYKIPFPVYAGSGILIIDVDYFGEEGSPFNLGISWGISSTPNVFTPATASTCFFELYYV